MKIYIYSCLALIACGVIGMLVATIAGSALYDKVFTLLFLSGIGMLLISTVALFTQRY